MTSFQNKVALFLLISTVTLTVTAGRPLLVGQYGIGFVATPGRVPEMGRCKWIQCIECTK